MFNVHKLTYLLTVDPPLANARERNTIEILHVILAHTRHDGWSPFTVDAVRCLHSSIVVRELVTRTSFGRRAERRRHRFVILSTARILKFSAVQSRLRQRNAAFDDVPGPYVNDWAYSCKATTFRIISSLSYEAIIIIGTLPKEFRQPAIHSSHAGQFGSTPLLLDLSTPQFHLKS